MLFEAIRQLCMHVLYDKILGDSTITVSANTPRHVTVYFKCCIFQILYISNAVIFSCSSLHSHMHMQNILNQNHLKSRNLIKISSKNVVSGYDTYVCKVLRRKLKIKKK